MDGLKQRVREGYLAHRLNQPELIRVVAELESEGASKSLKSLCEDRVDWRGKTEGSLEQAGVVRDGRKRSAVGTEHPNEEQAPSADQEET